ncbi:MAG: prolyl oligopeptidase family serine peptidase [Planctomycetaceae bacterium]|jgi:predicted esterase|nr:prolyl oligopeptidase family serine peptidase [Planctomycetaceae bacterium]
MKKMMFLMMSAVLFTADAPAKPPADLTQDQIEAVSIQPADGKLRDVMLQLFKEETLHYTQGEKFKDQDIKYRLHVPRNMEPGKKYPLVLWLHGAGECGNDNKRSLIHLHHILPYLTGTKQRDFFLLVPQCPKNSNWGSYTHSRIVHDTNIDDWIGPNKFIVNIPVNQTKLLWYQQLLVSGSGINVVPAKTNKEQTLKTSYTYRNYTGTLEVKNTLEAKTDKNGKPVKLTITTQTGEDGKEESKTETFEGEDNVRKAFKDFRVKQQSNALISNGYQLLKTSETDDGAITLTYGMELADTPLGYALAMVDDAVKRYPVDAERISVSGLSSGGEATWQAAEARPELFAAAVPIVSWRTWSEEAVKANPALKEIPVWSIYSSDDRDIDEARKNFETVANLGCNVKKTEFGVCGHNGWTPAMLQADIFSFMLSRGKKGSGYVQVDDPTVKPEEMKGIVEVATRDRRQPTLAPPAPNPNVGKGASGAERPGGESKTEILTSDGEKVEARMIEDCDRPWAMTSDSQYGLFAADWMKEAKALPQFVVDLPLDQLSGKLSKSVSGDGKDIAEVCRSIINMEPHPVSNPLFTTDGGRLRSDIKYALSEKGKMVERLLKTVAESKSDLADIAGKALKKMTLIVN